MCLNHEASAEWFKSFERIMAIIREYMYYYTLSTPITGIFKISHLENIATLIHALNPCFQFCLSMDISLCFQASINLTSNCDWLLTFKILTSYCDWLLNCWLMKMQLCYWSQNCWLMNHKPTVCYVTRIMARYCYTSMKAVLMNELLNRSG